MSISEELSEEYREIRNLVAEHMKWDMQKADYWMATKNPLLGDSDPISMLVRGRGKKLKSFVEALIHESSPPKGLTNG